MASGGSSGWLKVASGARLVASAILEQSSQETGVAAQRIFRHGTDLSQKAQQTAAKGVAMMPSQEALWSTVRQMIPDPENYNNDSFEKMTVTSGTSPYESQLRKKQQREQIIATVTASSEGAVMNGHGVTETAVGPNPYLFHQPEALEKSQTDSRAMGSSESIYEYDIASTALREEFSQKEHDTSKLSNGSIESSLNDTSTTITSPPTTTAANSVHDIPTTRLKEGQAVPSSRVGRAFGFASLGAGLAWGAVGELSARVVGSGSKEGNVVTTDANADRLAATLCRMRGAALKMGQMLSIQDESLLPPALTRALKQVRQGADAMPSYQLLEQLRSELGDANSSDEDSWRNKFESFDDQPFAAASIGQVHHATIRDKVTGEILPVVVKVQYPGVAQSIESDLGNLAMLVRMTGLAPKGLFIENVMRVGRDELKVECNYLNEMANQETFQSLVHSDPVLRANKFVVPRVFEELTSELVITTGYAPGGTIDKVSHLDQEERNRIGRTILYLTMQELFEWRLMQTDPNWGNFLYDVGTGTTTLIDFGATREFPKSFVDGYLRIVWASANRDEDTLMAQSRVMGFLTGEENDAMLRAHKLSGFTVGEPFWTDEPFDFQGSQISTRMGEHTSVFLRHRLT